jgi:hypothetical protein
MYSRYSVVLTYKIQFLFLILLEVFLLEFYASGGYRFVWKIHAFII